MNPILELLSPGNRPAGDRPPHPAHEDTAATRMSAIKSELERLSEAGGSLPSLEIVLPADGELRIRNIVHRGTTRPVFKTFSVKLDRSVHTESALEREFALLLEAAPPVDAYIEQPVRIHYVNDDLQRSHVPDFAILVHGKLWFVEVKFAKDVDQDIVERTTLMTERLARIGVSYRLVTEKEVRVGHQVQNATRILRRSRHSSCRELRLAVLHRLRSANVSTFGDFGWSSDESEVTSALCSLLVEGLAAYDEAELVSPSTRVWCSSSIDAKAVAA